LDAEYIQDSSEFLRRFTAKLPFFVIKFIEANIYHTILRTGNIEGWGLWWSIAGWMELLPSKNFLKNPKEAPPNYDELDY
jgi:hypothetical protein